jgi:glutamate-1-semialdehyde aminotransferase
VTDHGRCQLTSVGRHRPVRPAGLQHRDRQQGLRDLLEREDHRFRDLQAQDADFAELAWLYNLNRGIFMAPGREEEWTLSVMHTERAAGDEVAAFDELARDLTA